MSSQGASDPLLVALACSFDKSSQQATKNKPTKRQKEYVRYVVSKTNPILYRSSVSTVGT